jgi:hypothetical protein
MRMGKSSSQRRGERGEFYLFPADVTLGWRVIRMVSGAMGEEKLARGEWRDVYDEKGNHIGYQLLDTFHRDRSVFSSSYRCSVTITLTEVLMNAGLFGRSRTKGMPEQKRLARHAKDDDQKILPPEDAIERAIVKVKLWPFPASRIDDGTGEPVYGDRAIRVYPHTK